MVCSINWLVRAYSFFCNDSSPAITARRKATALFSSKKKKNTTKGTKKRIIRNTVVIGKTTKHIPSNYFQSKGFRKGKPTFCILQKQKHIKKKKKVSKIAKNWTNSIPNTWLLWLCHRSPALSLQLDLCLANCFSNSSMAFYLKKTFAYL